MDSGDGRFVMQDYNKFLEQLGNIKKEEKPHKEPDKELELKIQELKDKGLFFIGETLHIKNSNFEIVNIDPCGIMKLKLLPKIK